MCVGEEMLQMKELGELKRKDEKSSKKGNSTTSAAGAGQRAATGRPSVSRHIGSVQLSISARGMSHEGTGTVRGKGEAARWTTIAQKDLNTLSPARPFDAVWRVTPTCAPNGRLLSPRGLSCTWLSGTARCKMGQLNFSSGVVVCGSRWCSTDYGMPQELVSTKLPRMVVS